MTNIPTLPQPGRIAITLSSDFESDVLNNHIPVKEVWSEAIPEEFQTDAQEAFPEPLSIKVTGFAGLENGDFDVNVEIEYPEGDLPQVVHDILAQIPDKVTLLNQSLGPIGTVLALLHVPSEGVAETIEAQIAYIPPTSSPAVA